MNNLGGFLVSGGGPSSLSISEETAVSMLVTWVHPNAHVLQYRVSYTPLNGDARENSVSAFRRVKLILYCLCVVELFCPEGT